MQAKETPVLPFRAPTTAEPANIDAEYEILGSLLIDPGAMTRVVHKLKPEAFYVHKHRQIFESCLAVHASGQVIDLMTLCTELANRKQLDRVGGKPAIAQMFDACVTSANIDQHADLVMERYCRRCMAAVGSKIQQMAKDTSKGVDACLSDAQRQMSELLELATTGSNVLMLSDVIMSNFEQMEAIQAGTESTGIPTNFYDLDVMTGGVKPGRLVILAGRPSMGKSAGLVNVATEVAKQGHGVYIASLEMSAQSIGYRCMSSDASVEFGRLRTGKIGNQEWEGVGHSIAKLSGFPVWIDDNFRQTPESITANIQRINAEHGEGTIKLVMVDYLQLMGERGSANRVSELGRISRGFKGMSKDLNLEVWALSQLSRGVESRTCKRPMMSDLRESGNIEEDADLILMLYRDEYYNPDTVDRGIAEWIVAKNRNGPTGTVKLLFEGQYARFRNLAG